MLAARLSLRAGGRVHGPTRVKGSGKARDARGRSGGDGSADGDLGGGGAGGQVGAAGWEARPGFGFPVAVPRLTASRSAGMSFGGACRAPAAC